MNCDYCGAALTLPAIHYLCGHSYHYHRCSSSDGDHECHKCGPDFRKVKEIKESMKISVSHHDRFFKQLEDSKDGFSTVAEFFGRAIFDKEVRYGSHAHLPTSPSQKDSLP